MAGEMADKISLIVPCYNEEAALPAFYEAVSKIAAKIQAGGVLFEFIFVDDGSSDGTLEVLKGLAKKDERVRYISFSRNFGKEAAMYAGFCSVSGDYAAVMDADLQDPPELLPEMYNAVTREGYDSAATRRVSREGEPPARSFFAKLFYKIINHISDADIVDGARDFRLMNRKMIDAIISMGENNRFSKGIFGWIGFKTKWIAFVNKERIAGETKWSFWKLFKYSISGIVSFSEIPLMISSVAGLICCAASFICVLIIILRRLIFGDPVAGWASLACIITFIGGLQLLCMGIMGQYLARTYIETKNRPIYIVRESNIEGGGK